MSPTLSPRRVRAPAHVQLTLEERRTLLAYVDPPNALDEVFLEGRVAGPVVHLELDGDQLEEFFRCLEEAARSAMADADSVTLERMLARIEAGFNGTVDPGWHMLRPAIVRLDYTRKQGQYLAFIHMYTRLHRRAPAEADIQAYFQSSPPVVHEILKALQRKRFISRQPRAPRSIRVLVPPHAIPELE